MPRLNHCPSRNDELKRRRQHHAKDGNDHTQVQKQITACDYIQPKDERQDVIDDHQYNTEQWQQTLAMCEVV